MAGYGVICYYHDLTRPGWWEAVLRESGGGCSGCTPTWRSGLMNERVISCGRRRTSVRWRQNLNLTEQRERRVRVGELHDHLQQMLVWKLQLAGCQTGGIRSA